MYFVKRFQCEKCGKWFSNREISGVEVVLGRIVCKKCGKNYSINMLREFELLVDKHE